MTIIGKKYDNLPGMLIDFKDGGKALRFKDNTGNTDSILLLGTAVDGPVMEPIAVDDETIELLFGKETKQNGIPNGSTLVTAFKQARACGAEDVRVMRVSGSIAKADISAPSNSVTSTKRVDEELGIIEGNNTTTLSLGAIHSNKENHEVFVRSIALEQESFNVSSDGNTITIQEGKVNAGASVMVRFDYDKVNAVASKEYKLNSEKQVILEHEALAANITVTSPNNAEFTVSGKTVTFSALGAGSKVVLSYTYVTKEAIQITETPKATKKKTASGRFMTETSIQQVPLKDIPFGEKVILYIDEAKILNTSSYSVTKVGEVGSEKYYVNIKKEFFDLGSKISISYNVEKQEEVERVIHLSSRYGGATYNLGLVEVEPILNAAGDEEIGKVVKITKPETKLSTGELPQAYSSLNFPTFGDLVDAINANNIEYVAKTDQPETLTKELDNVGTYFSEGDDGINLNKEDMFKALSGVKNERNEIITPGAYNLLENYLVDTVVPLGVFADDELLDRHQNFAYELALFCAATSQKNRTVYGVIPMKPLKDISLLGIQEHAEYLTKYDNTYFMKDMKGKIITTREGDVIDLGKFISVVAGPTPIIRHQVPALREANPAVVLAALSSTLIPQSAPTNKNLKGVSGIKFTFSDAQLDAIIGNRMITYANKYSLSGRAIQGCVCVDGVTAARKDSEYTRHTTMKILRDVANHTREVSEPFIGEPNTIEQRNALSALLSKRYDQLVELGELLTYEMNLISTAEDVAIGQARLELSVYVPEELRKITTVMGLKK